MQSMNVNDQLIRDLMKPQGRLPPRSCPASV